MPWGELEPISVTARNVHVGAMASKLTSLRSNLAVRGLQPTGSKISRDGALSTAGCAFADHNANPLVVVARPVLEAFRRLLIGSSTLVLLTDAAQIVIALLGDALAQEAVAALGLALGADAAALFGDAFVVRDSLESGLVRLSGCTGGDLFGLAAPVFGPEGRPAAWLAVVALKPVEPVCGRALLDLHRCVVEDRLLEGMPDVGVVMRVQSESALLGSPLDGLAVFDSDGRLLARNRAAESMLPQDWVPGRNLASSQGMPWSQVLRRCRDGSGQPIDLSLFARRPCFVRVEHRCNSRWTRPSGGAGASDWRTLEDLPSEDSRMAEAVERARRIVERDIPLLIQGETGSGKEWFARAFHASGSRRHGPFVAVNCAAIPSGLIEAELFGYVDGAYTGARRSGAPGKIREADGGTLFLDEIGDMPLGLQAVLLRVLETRAVVPLGGAVEQPVDIALVCASHQPLQSMVAQGVFRADLFFRLSGMTVSLPALRERSDFVRVVNAILLEESTSRAIRVSPEALRLLRRYSWPGNLRQLRYVLRLSIALLDGEAVVDVEHLPQEILESQVSKGSSGADLRAVQARLVQETLARHGGNVSAAARALGVSRATLHRKLNRLGIGEHN